MKDLTIDDILSLLQGTTPVSIVRCGDGEKIVLDGFKSYGNFNAVLKRQLGFSPPISHAEEIRLNLIKAINGCDIIGVPRHKNLDSLGNNWSQVEQTIKIYCDAPEKKCSLDIHYDFLTAGYFDKLLMNMKELNYISCRDLEFAFQKRYNIKVANRYEIAPEAKFTSYEGKPHYPDQFNKVERWMDKVGADGKILLVGAGFIGKIYCNWWRDRGGRAFDIGSIFDEWAGRVTRGPERELDKEDLSQHYLLKEYNRAHSK